MQWESIGDSYCSIARALSVVGDRWTLLILREAFAGAHRFDDFRQRLGIARNVLSLRLRGLVRDGVLERIPSAGRGRRVEYRLTEKGRDLFPVLLALQQWGDRWFGAGDEPTRRIIHRACGNETEAVFTCNHCGGEIGARTVRAEPLPSVLTEA